jgi:WD40 repeat protein
MQTIWSIAFNTDGTRLISGSQDNRVRVWDVETGQCLMMLEGHTYPVQGISVQGHLIASASRDHTVRLWSLHSGECTAILQGHTAWVKAVAFSPDGQTLASGAEDGTIRFWRVSDGQLQRIIHAPRPYEGMNIAGTIGLTDAQRETLRALGAVV